MLVGILSMQKNCELWIIYASIFTEKIVESLGHRVVFVDYKPNVLVKDRNDKTKTNCFIKLKDGIKFTF